MKKIIGLFILAIPFVFSGCNDPEETDCIYADKRFCDPNFNGGDIELGTVEFSADLTEYSSKILLEDFTGFRCTNCLPATITGKNLKEANPDRLSFIAVHTSEFFAAPLTDDPNEPYFLDFRTPESEVFFVDYGINSIGLPTGIINRIRGGGTATYPFSQWEDRVNGLLESNDPELFLQITNIEITEDRDSASVFITAKPLQDLSKNYLINVAVTEDGIEEAQKDSDSPGGEILDYVHDNVLRYSGYGPYGIPFLMADLELNPTEALAFKLTVEISDDWVLENCRIIVYASDELSLEVAQVEETMLVQ